MSTQLQQRRGKKQKQKERKKDEMMLFSMRPCEYSRTA